VQGSIKINFYTTEMRANANIREITKLDPSHDKVIPYIVITSKIYAKICTWKLWCTKYMNTTYQNIVSHVYAGAWKIKAAQQ
jgi:hypothetical protein